MEDGDNGSGTGHLLDSLKDLREAVDLDYKTRKKRKHGRVIAEETWDDEDAPVHPQTLSLQMHPVRFNGNKDHILHVSQSAADDTLSKPLRNHTRRLEGEALCRSLGSKAWTWQNHRAIAAFRVLASTTQDDSPWGIETKNG
jgi:hypothetical protein